ncbi:MAG: PDZ domain-containing protein [Xanthomonadales bacterium]|nr:PDZ domain-containing protein [Gammaproteobacteria bacterium]MBT8050351.1 PDZ domain-containing protein [Gammaproteobacteria bacterium]NNJ80015.1 PDZ domain-containing protein [Xanthomonadales bacterium]NNL05885.1 PDZ domain-containing protein [Xanthomonadales bacterium]
MFKAHVFLLALMLSTSPSAWAASPLEETRAATEAELAKMIEGAEAARREAESARMQAYRIAEHAEEALRLQRESIRVRAERGRERNEAIASDHARQEEEIARAREELSRAHRELRDAQREVARAHRELSRGDAPFEAPGVFTGLGDRPVIGVVMGNETQDGIELVGVSPGGPAEKAGLRVGDLMVSIGGMRLDGDQSGGKAAVFELMENTKAGDEIEIVVDRGNEERALGVVAEVREPASWQSLQQILETTSIQRIEGEDGEHQLIIERALAPEIDETALAERLEIIEERFGKHGELLHGKSLELAPHSQSEYEFIIEDFSDIAGQAFEGANVWFGLPRANGLELASLNEQLGSYFETDRGVLVLQAREDNAYGLQPGDVVLSVAGKDVSSPSDFMRALRSQEPGREIELSIKRKGREQSLNVVMPENRFGLR